VKERSTVLDRQRSSRFKHVLNYLRSGTVTSNDIATLEAVAEEAKYFSLAQLKVMYWHSLACVHVDSSILCDVAGRILRSDIRTRDSSNLLA